MTFAGGNKDGKHYWLTPPDLYKDLDEEFHFNYDPCPYPLPESFDGLTSDWGSSSYVNPPFGSIIQDGKKKGPTAWAKKAIAEYLSGKKVVFVYPIDKWVLKLLAHASEVRNLGDVRWHSIEENKAGKGNGRHVGCFILNPKPKDRKAVLLQEVVLKMHDMCGLLSRMEVREGTFKAILDDYRKFLEDNKDELTKMGVYDYANRNN